MVEFKEYVSHSQSIEYLTLANVCFLPIHKPLNDKPPLSIPGKTYEYMAMGKPILALVPPGEARDLVRNSGLGFICDPTNIEEIAQNLLNLLHQHRTPGGIKVKANREFIYQFERKTLTKKLKKVLDFAIDNYYSEY